MRRIAREPPVQAIRELAERGLDVGKRHYR
jgi:hypothetical protein